MTSQTRVTNKALFENGDVPTGSNYRDLIDSYVSLVDTTAQSVTSKLTAGSLAATTVSAGTLYADSIVAGSQTFTGIVSADAGIVVSGATKFNTIVSAHAGLAVNGATRFSTIVSADAGIRVSGNTSAAALFADSIVVAGAARFSTVVSADAGITVSGAAIFTGTVSAATIFVDTLTAGNLLINNARGCLHIATAGATATNVSGGITNTFIKAKGTTDDHDLVDVSATDNKLTYVGTDTKEFIVICNVSVSGTNNSDFQIGVAKNGAIIAGSEMERRLTTGGDIGSMGTNTFVSLGTDDFVEIFVRSDTAGPFTLHKLAFSINQI